MLCSLSRTHTVILSLRDTRPRNNSDNIAVNSTLRVKALDLKFVKLDKELLDEFIENIVTFAH